MSGVPLRTNDPIPLKVMRGLLRTFADSSGGSSTRIVGTGAAPAE